MTVFFIANQDLNDGSAHALYCLRNCWWLAKANPDLTVELWHGPEDAKKNPFAGTGLASIGNLHIAALPSVRKKKGSWGLTLNSVFHLASYLQLAKKCTASDVVIIASFPKLFRFLFKGRFSHGRPSFVYEVHQLAILERGEQSGRARREIHRISGAQLYPVTTSALGENLRKHLPQARVEQLPLGCGTDPSAIPEARSWPTQWPKKEAIHVGYIGSVYREQGIEWLVTEWEKVKKLSGQTLELHMAGGSKSQVEALKKLALKNFAKDIVFHGRVEPSNIGAFLENIDLLIIPSLDEGRMPYVAITKAYDYLAMKRPVLAADIPSIAEIMRDESEAVLFLPGSSAKLAAALNFIVQNPEIRQQLVTRSLIRAQALSWQERSRRYGSWLKEMKNPGA